MEELDAAWRDIQAGHAPLPKCHMPPTPRRRCARLSWQGRMGIDNPTSIQDHMNGQNQRRQGTLSDIEQEMGGMAERIVHAVEVSQERSLGP